MKLHACTGTRERMIMVSRSDNQDQGHSNPISTGNHRLSTSGVCFQVTRWTVTGRRSVVSSGISEFSPLLKLSATI